MTPGQSPGPLANAAEAAARRLEAGGRLVGDHLNLHQILQSVTWVFVVTGGLGPGWLGRLHRPEGNGNLPEKELLERGQMWWAVVLSPSAASQPASPPQL